MSGRRLRSHHRPVRSELRSGIGTVVVAEHPSDDAAVTWARARDDGAASWTLRRVGDPLVLALVHRPTTSWT